MNTFKPGDSVTVTTGPMKGLYGIIVTDQDEQGKYLVRFTGQQQMFYTEDEIVPWT